jgi:hypothetical protein
LQLNQVSEPDLIASVRGVRRETARAREGELDVNDAEKLRVVANFEARAKSWCQWYMCGFGDELPEFYAAERALARIRRQLQQDVDSTLLDRYERRLKAFWSIPWVESSQHVPHVQKVKARLIRERKKVFSALGLTALIPAELQTAASSPNSFSHSCRLRRPSHG